MSKCGAFVDGLPGDLENTTYTYRELSDVIAETIEVVSPLSPPAELADWHSKALEFYQIFQEGVDSQPAQNVIGDELWLVLFALWGLLEEILEIERELPAEIQRRMAEAGCSFAYEADGFDEPETLLGTFSAGESVRVGDYEVEVTRAYRNDDGELVVRTEVRNVGDNPVPVPDCGTHMRLQDQAGLPYQRISCAWSGRSRDDMIYPGNTVNYVASYQVPEGTAGLVWQISDGTTGVTFDLSEFLAFTVETDRAALVAFYHATDGPNWTNNTHWLSDRPISDWYGVSVGFLDGRVEGLYLVSNQLSGQIPPELGNLSRLKSLSIFRNRLTGCIPASLRGVPTNDFEMLGLPFCDDTTGGTGTEPVQDHHGDTIGGATAITLGEAVEGSIDWEGDFDVFRYTAEAGKEYRLDVELGTLSELWAWVLDSNGNQFQFTVVSSLYDDKQVLFWRAEESGYLYVEVRGGFLSWETGSYTLTVSVAQ